MEERFMINGTNLTILVPAELDHHNAEELKNRADQLIQRRNIRSITFDFGKTGFMDSSGIGMIMGRYKNMRFMGGTVIAIRVNERVRRILTLSGVYKYIDIYEGLPQQSKLCERGENIWRRKMKCGWNLTAVPVTKDLQEWPWQRF